MGDWTMTSSPTAPLISARPTGDDPEIRPSLGDDSCVPTISMPHLVAVRLDGHDRAEPDARSGGGRLDDDGVAELRLDGLDPALQERLLLARGRVVRVLLEVAELLGRADPADDLGPLLRRQDGPLGLEPGDAVRGQVDLLRARIGARDRGRRRRRDRLRGRRTGARRRSGLRGGRACLRVAGPRGSPRAPSASPSGTVTTYVGGSGASAVSGSSAPVIPVWRRSPVTVRRFANGTTMPAPAAASRSDSAVGSPSANAVSSASSYSSTAGRGRPPDPGRVEAAQRVQPVARRRSVGGRRGSSSPWPPRGTRWTPRSPRRTRPAATAPRTSRAAREFLGGRPCPVQPERLDALQPLADPGQLERRGRQGSGQFDHEDAGPADRDRAAPHDRTIGHEAHGPEQVRGAGVVGHPAMVPGITRRRIARRRAASSERRRTGRRRSRPGRRRRTTPRSRRS